MRLQRHCTATMWVECCAQCGNVTQAIQDKWNVLPEVARDRMAVPTTSLATDPESLRSLRHAPAGVCGFMRHQYIVNIPLPALGVGQVWYQTWAQHHRPWAQVISVSHISVVAGFTFIRGLIRKHAIPWYGAVLTRGETTAYDISPGWKPLC